MKEEINYLISEYRSRLQIVLKELEHEHSSRFTNMLEMRKAIYTDFINKLLKLL